MPEWKLLFFSKWGRGPESETKNFWMQPGIKNRQAADLLTAAGIDIVMDMCIKVEHEKLC